MIRQLLNWMGQPKNLVKTWVIVLWAMAIYRIGYDNATSDWDQSEYSRRFVQARMSVQNTVDSKIRKIKNAKKQIGLTIP